MIVQRYSSARLFLDAVEPWLLEREAENGLILGIANAVALTPDGGASAYFAAVMDRSQPVIAAFSSVPDKLGVSRAFRSEAVALLASDAASACPSLETVGGPEPTSEAFAQEVAQLRGTSATLAKAMRIHQLHEVKPPSSPPPGRLRLADESDLPLIIRWTQQFLREIDERGDGIRQATNRVHAQEVYLWDDGGPVSMAAESRKTRHGVGVNLVFTPDERRNRGYASVCVADLSARLLAQGNQFCCLYTDLANPTSNAIYSRIGYEPVCDAGLYAVNREGA